MLSKYKVSLNNYFIFEKTYNTIIDTSIFVN